MATSSVGSSRLVALCTGALLALSAMVSPAALSDQPAMEAPETRTARVALGDLDLSTPEGARVARDRLQETARQLCARLAESRDVARSWHLRACIDATLASALRQIRSSTLASATDSRARRSDVSK
jgi:UrcA family protein